MFSNRIPSTIPKLWTFKLLRWMRFWTAWWIWMKFCMELMTLKVMSVTPKWPTFKLLKWMQNLYQLTRGREIVHADRSLKAGQVSVRNFCESQRNTNCGGRLNVKTNTVFHEDNSWTVGRRQMKFVTVKDYGHTYKFYLNRAEHIQNYLIK